MHQYLVMQFIRNTLKKAHNFRENMRGYFRQSRFKAGRYTFKLPDIFRRRGKASYFVCSLLVHSAVFRRQKYNRFLCFKGVGFCQAKFLKAGQRLTLALRFFKCLNGTFGVFIRVRLSFFKCVLKCLGVLDFGFDFVNLIRAGIAYGFCCFAVVHRP